MTDQLSFLIQGSRRGDRQAQHALYQAFAPAVFGVCLRYAQDAQEADDFAQETWIQALTHLNQYRADGEYGAWLRRVAVTCCLQQLRRRRKQINWANAATELAASHRHGQLDPTAIANLSAEELLGHIQQLPDGHRLVFNLVAVEGYSHAEAAAALGIAESSSRSHLTRARQSLQQRLAHLLTLCL